MKQHINADIQALRGIAIILVLVQHFANRLPTAQWFHDIFRYFSFWGGVDLFFVISGYVITRSLLDDGSVGPDGRITWERFRRFWMRRFFRLLPASWFWLGFSVGTAGLLTATLPHEPWALVRTVIYTVGGIANYRWAECAMAGFPAAWCTSGDIAGPQWSLALEEQFYLALSLGLLFIGLRKFAVVGVMAVVAYTVWFGLSSYEMKFFSLPWAFRPHGLVSGVLLAIAWNAKFTHAMPRRAVRQVLIGGLIVLLCAVPPAMPLKWAIPALAAISSAVVLLALPDGAISQRGAFRVLEWIGERSYSLYLCHLPVFLLLKEYLVRLFGSELLAVDSGVLTVVSLVVAFGLSILVADISYRTIETPFRRLGKRTSLSNDCTGLSTRLRTPG